jgi:hypothetical protein
MTMMGKFLLTGLLTVLACAAAVEARSQTMVVKVTAERTSVREMPATDAAVVATVMKGDELDVLEARGAWYRVRVKSTSREGFVHSLFVERSSGGSTTTPASSPSASQPPPASSSAPAASAPAASSSQRPPVATPQAAGSPAATTFGGERHLGLGLTSGGLAFGFSPSFRLWTDSNLGFEVNASFLDSYGYSVTAVSPSVLMRVGEPKHAGGMVSFQPYWGAGLTWWHYSTGFYDYYCDLPGADCSQSAFGFGGFGGAEITFEKVPKLAVSANLGFFSSPDVLGYGGLYLSIAGHWYFK